jgi:hypothetical protein
MTAIPPDLLRDVSTLSAKEWGEIITCASIPSLHAHPAVARVAARRERVERLHGPDVAPSFINALDHQADWRQRAACADAPDPDVFFHEPFSRDRNGGGGGPARTEALLYCASCPVRPECLRESFVTWKVRVRDEAASTQRSTGTWGGTTAKERRAVLHLPPDERVRVLEESFPDRLAERVAAFEKQHPAGDHPNCTGATTRSGSDGALVLGRCSTGCGEVTSE